MEDQSEEKPMTWIAFSDELFARKDMDQHHVVVELTSGVLLFGRVIQGGFVGYDPHEDRYNDPVEPHHIRRVLVIRRVACTAIS